jgi:hypothetical protein
MSSPSLRRHKRRGKAWQCPLCKSGVVLYVDVEIPPTCRNSSVHSTKTINMKEK